MSVFNNIRDALQSQQPPKFDWPALRKAIAFYESEGLCYLPAAWGHKNPSMKWEEFLTRLPTMAEKADWFHEGKPTNIGVLCGAASGGVVALCFNEPDGAVEFFGEDQWHKLLTSTFVTKSVRGYHVWLRSDTPIRSQFVRKGDNESWLEIRSGGNFVVAPPSLHPNGILYQAIGAESIAKPKNLAGFIDQRLAQLGLKARATRETRSRPKETRGGERPGEINALAVEKLLESCAFIQHCQDNAITLSEPWWWGMIHNLAVFGEPGRDKAHELSAPHPRYSDKETDQKIEEAIKAATKGVSPHTCKFIEQELGFACPEDCLAKKLDVKSPAGLASRLAAAVYRYGELIREESEKEEVIPSTPHLPEDVWQGLFGDYRELVADTTEASDNYHYACFAQLIGTTLARRAHVYHARRLFPNFYVCLVGRTAVTRKDTSWSRARDILERLHTNIDVENPAFQIIPGIGSAEGLIDALGGERKVVLLNESEFLSLLSKARQEGLANLIPKLASLYDCPDRETLKTRTKAVECKEPFLSIISGTTHSWLQQALTEKEIYGGFANRFMYICGEPKDPMPFPPKVDAVKRDALVNQINDIRLWAEELRADNGGELTASDEAKGRFAAYYAEYHKRCASESLSAALIPRVQSFVWKLALLYAAMDFSQEIKINHLEPAILAGNFLEQSAVLLFHAFGASRSKQVEEKLLAFLQSKGKGVPIPQREVYRALSLSAAELEQAAKPLQRLGLIRNSPKMTEKGRKVLCYEAL